MLCKHVRTEIGRLHLIMKDMEAQPGTDESAVQEFNVAVSKKEKKLFAANVVFNIHYSLDNPLVIIAWEVVDVVD